MARPLMKMIFKEKATNKKFEVGVMWPAREGQESFGPSIQPHTESSDNGQYTPIMSYAEALERSANKEGFINTLVTDPGLRDFLGMGEPGGGNSAIGAPLQDDF